ncbi:MAG: hypothetical protein J6J83_00880 [Oscillospiraceae bacterium]|nr:hypothetical protein [Oscillospiraceae bacterium]
MTANEALQILLRSYMRYYNVKEEDVAEPFAAEAAFHSKDVQYFLVKSVKMSESESHEYIYFAVSDHLTLAQAQELDEAAWQRGMAQVDAKPGHRNTDIHLIVLADKMDDDAAKFLKKLHRYESYHHTFWGWSHYCVVAMETSSGRLVFNRMGQSLKKIFRNIKSAIKKESNEK